MLFLNYLNFILFTPSYYLIEKQLFDIQCIGCDAAFGSDHSFLDSLPKSIYYFASVRENERIFRHMPEVIIPEQEGLGGRFKHPRAAEEPISIKSLVEDESIPWVKHVLSEGTKGATTAQIKYLRCVSSRKENRLYVPKSEIWIYIRKHEDGTIKYFISNMPGDTDIRELNRLASSRGSIEQCFQESKSYLGMADYETGSYPAWHRHMLLVMISQLFVTLLRDFLKGICPPNHANGTLYHGFINSHPHKA